MDTVTADQDVERQLETVERLVRAADGRDAELANVVDALGAGEVAALAVEELVFRCAPPGNPVPVDVQLDLVHGVRRLVYTLSVRAGEAVTATPEGSGTACARLEFELTQLLRLLYGPADGRTTGTHRTELLVHRREVLAAYAYVKDQGGLGAVLAATSRATATVLGALAAGRPPLDELAVRYGADKWGPWHWFAPHYERHLQHLRDRPVRVLEIGIGGYRDPNAGGESLRMWKRYFHRGVITGVDVFEKHGLRGPRLRVLRGDQGDPEFLASLAAYGPFDVIVDDGSHVSAHVRAGFAELFRHLRPGGCYVIEDLWTSYCPGFGGDADPAAGTTSLALLKSLIDSIHYEERTDAGATGGYPDAELVGLHVYHNVAFLEKGVNAEGGIPSWIPRSIDALVTDPTDRAGRR
ncbi:class I SAM-dependent methyltransferase [Virgisporangium aurantiacum]|uniref:class I SAM-dependent methyltransferase n=1 Tax=Virgisporangium aurantiacum TaxID=175570 RepID=UPI0019526B4F|nr:class I SAM-dependent methyltransferase [Virgisporangium aurantiacum]